MLLQISTALSIFEGSSINFKTRFAALLFSSAKERIRILFTVVNAVSAEEKYADNMSKIIIISISSIVSFLNNFILFFIASNPTYIKNPTIPPTKLSIISSISNTLPI